MFGSLISGGLSLLGGILGNKSQEDAGAANAAMQKEFAQQGIRWKVADAKAAGINPLFAMGAPAVSFSPSFAGDSPMGSAVASAGQDISRAVNATRTQPERDSALRSLELERAQLQNEFLRTQIAGSKVAVMQQAGGNPAFPGQKNVYDERTLNRVGDPSLTASAPKPAVTEFINKDGSVTLWPSPDAKQAIEDNFIYENEHVIRNRLFPWIKDTIRRTPQGPFFGRGRVGFRDSKSFRKYQ